MHTRTHVILYLKTSKYLKTLEGVLISFVPTPTPFPCHVCSVCATELKTDTGDRLQHRAKVSRLYSHIQNGKSSIKSVLI